MKTLVFAICLMIMQAPQPLPRQASDGGTHASKSVKTKAQNQQQQPTPAVAPPAVGSADSRDGADYKQQSDQPYPIRVIALPTKDWADWVFWIASVALAVAGIAGVCFAYGTLK